MGVSIHVTLCICESLSEYMEDLVVMMKKDEKVIELITLDKHLAERACLEILATDEWWYMHKFDEEHVSAEFTKDKTACLEIMQKYNEKALCFLFLVITKYICLEEGGITDSEFMQITSDEFCFDDLKIPEDSEDLTSHLEMRKMYEDKRWIVLNEICCHSEKFGVDSTVELSTDAMVDAVASTKKMFPSSKLRLITCCSD